MEWKAKMKWGKLEEKISSLLDAMRHKKGHCSISFFLSFSSPLLISRLLCLFIFIISRRREERAKMCYLLFRQISFLGYKFSLPVAIRTIMRNITRLWATTTNVCSCIKMKINAREKEKGLVRLNDRYVIALEA